MALKTIVVDDNPTDLARIRAELTRENLAGKIDLLGAASDYETAEQLLYDHFYDVDLVFLDMTLEPGNDVNLDSDFTGPGLLEKVRQRRRSRAPFGVIFFTQYLELWAVELITAFNPPETLLGVLHKWRSPRGDRSFAEQVETCLERFERRFMLIPDARRAGGERWVLSERLENEYFARRIFLHGVFADSAEEAARLESLGVRTRRDHIQFFIMRDGFCEVKIEGRDQLFFTEETGADLKELLEMMPEDDLRYTEFNRVVNGYFFCTKEFHYVNITAVGGHDNHAREGVQPHGGWAVVEGRYYLPIANTGRRNELQALTARWGGRPPL